MNDQPTQWEDNWRDELAGYEAPLQAGDWAAMDKLLDGGTAVPPESLAPGSTFGGAWIKGVLFGLGLAVAAGLCYLVLVGSPPAIDPVLRGAVVTDTLPPGYRYEIKEYRIRNQNGRIKSINYDTTIVPIQYRKDASYQTDERGNLTIKVDSIPVSQQTSRYKIEVMQVEYAPIKMYYDTVFRLDRNGNIIGIERIDSVLQRRAIRASVGGTSAREIPDLSDLAPLPSPAPATPPKDEWNMEIGETHAAPNTRRRNPLRHAEVYPMMIRVETGFPSYDELLRQRLLREVAEHPLPIRAPHENNGYFPPVRNDY